MEAIRLAASNNDYAQMSDVLTVFLGIVNAIIDVKLDNTELGHNICEVYEVYKLEVAAWK